MSSVNPARRLRSETWDLEIRLRDASGEEHVHALAVCLAVDQRYGLRELNFVSRSRSGSGLDELLSELGIQLSRIIQGRNPLTGAKET